MSLMQESGRLSDVSKPQTVYVTQLLSSHIDPYGQWKMDIQFALAGAVRRTTLSIPEYLKRSAKAAADILKVTSQYHQMTTVTLKLIHVRYDHGRFLFPDSLDAVDTSYPMLVILPEYMVNVTALTHFDYCPRNFLMDRYSLPGTSAAMMRGSLVHHVFGAVLRNPADIPKMIEACNECITDQLPQLVMHGIDSTDYYMDARPHLNTLAASLNGCVKTEKDDEVFIERFMVNPHLGLKGKIDALIHRSNGHWQAIELKTGKSQGHAANQGHAFQVSAYQLLLSQAGIGPLDPPCVLYTGTNARRLRDGVPSLPPSAMLKDVPFDAKKAVDIINLRNEVVAIDHTGQQAYNENSNKCRACVKNGKAAMCVMLSELGLSGGMRPAEHLNELLLSCQIDRDQAALFKTFNRALRYELQAHRLQHGAALQEGQAVRISEGSCLRVKKRIFDPAAHTVQLIFPEGNQSEFREGDPCLLSDAAGPVQGNCMEVYIRHIDRDAAEVTVPKGVDSLWFEPALLDANAPDSAYERNFAALYLLVTQADAAHAGLKQLGAFLTNSQTAIPPNIPQPVNNLPPDAASLLDAQQQAVSLALGLQNILLIQGPPGAGKTFTLAHIVKALTAQGKRIMLATYTHRAADEVMSKLEACAPEIQVRKLGRPESTAARHKDKCLVHALDVKDREAPPSTGKAMLESMKTAAERISRLLAQPSVYVGTTQAWMSAQYDHLLKNDTGTPLFDVAVIDEASQIILPNLLGVLRLAHTWILIGDHRQLPPVVSEETADVLGVTLFESLAEKFDQDPTHLVRLNVQHRMPPAIAHFISQQFYSNKLHSAESCTNNAGAALTDHPLLHRHVPLQFIDVKDRADPIHPRQSADEARWIAATLKELYASGLPVMDGAGRFTVGIIAPFRSQVALIRRQLEQDCATWGNAAQWAQLVDTVDRFQGDERHIIFFSLCLHPDQKYVSRTYQDARRINVALSRVKSHLCLVGDLSALDQVPTLKNFLNYAMKHPQAMISKENARD